MKAAPGGWRGFFRMRILIFSVFPHPLLDSLGEYLASGGNDVINLSGKRSHGSSSPGVRRIIMNFDEGGRAEDHPDAWKRALKNGFFGLKALRSFGSSWQPDIILCRSGLGAAFFVKEAFPDAFICGFASNLRETEIATELDARLFLESDMRFAPDRKAVLKFPRLMQDAIELEPVCIDADFFKPGLGKPFSSWKLDPKGYECLAIVLTGLAENPLQAWLKAIVEVLAKNPGKAAVALTDRKSVTTALIRAISTMPGRISERLFATDHLDKDAWRDLCTTIPVVFTSETQKRHLLECVASGGSAWIANGSGLETVPGANLLSPTRSAKPQLLKVRFIATDAQAIETVSQKHDCARMIPEFAERLLSECRQAKAPR